MAHKKKAHKQKMAKEPHSHKHMDVHKDKMEKEKMHKMHSSRGK